MTRELQESEEEAKRGYRGIKEACLYLELDQKNQKVEISMWWTQANVASSTTHDD